MPDDMPIEVYIDPEDVVTLYFHAAPGQDGVALPSELGPVQVSVDRGRTWKTLTLGADRKQVPAYPWVVAGLDVAPVPVGVDATLTASMTECLSRIVDTPEITTKAFTIYCSR